jgi:hypothetical protein
MNSLISHYARLSASPIFYFPQGQYYFNGTLDFSSLPAWGLRGDCSSPTAPQGSNLRATGKAFTFLKADYTGSSGRFSIQDCIINNNGTGPGFYIRNAALSNVLDCRINGTVDMSNCFKVCFQGVEWKGTVQMQCCYACTLENTDANTGTSITTLNMGGSINCAVYGSRFEVEHIAINIGYDINGNPSSCAGISLQSISCEANDFGIILDNATNCFLAGIGIAGSNNAPSRHSSIGLQLLNASGCQFANVQGNAAFSSRAGGDTGWAIQVTSSASNATFVSCVAANSSPSANGTFQVNGSAILSNGTYGSTIVTTACAYR